MAAQQRRNNRRPRVKQAPVPLPKEACEVVVERLAHDGRGIAYVDGKVTFVEQGLPGERHRVKVVGGKSKFYDAVSTQLLSEPAVNRQVAPCAHYESCGGCQLQHLNAAAQLEFKQNLVADQCRRNGVTLPSFEAPLYDNPLGYRSRCRLSINHKGEAFAGFRQKGQSQLIKVSECGVLTKALEKLLAPLQSILKELPARALGHLELIDDACGAIVIVRHVGELANAHLQRLQSLAEQLDVQLLLQAASEPDYVTCKNEPVNPQLNLTVPFLDQPLRYRPQDFTQVNRTLNLKMIEQAIAWLPLSSADVWIDLFCGIGNFTFPLARHVAEVHGVEGVPDMVAQANINAKQQGVGNCQFYAADLEGDSIYRKLPQKIDGVLLDPPRAGAKAVMPHIGKLAPPAVLYVSCDPATFARDAQQLCAQGYSITKIGIIDMFPQTMHVETMALFSR